MLIKAPWTDAEVTKLNAFQTCGWMHPFTCVYQGDVDHGGTATILVAKNDGFECPVCGLRQNWAHDFMLEGAPPAPSFGV